MWHSSWTFDVISLKPTYQAEEGRQGDHDKTFDVIHIVQICIKTSFFDVVSELEKKLQVVSAGIGIFKHKVHKKFSPNLTSITVRSTLTLPGRVK
jgi:hypothetical protein